MHVMFRREEAAKFSRIFLRRHRLRPKAIRFDRKKGGILVLHHRANVVARQPGAALQKIEFNDESEAGDFTAEFFDKLRYRLRRASGGEHIVNDQNIFAGIDRVAVDFENIRSIFKLILDALGDRGELFRFSYWYESGIERIRDGGGEDESAGLDSHDLVNSLAGIGCSEFVDKGAKARCVF